MMKIKKKDNLAASCRKVWVKGKKKCVEERKFGDLKKHGMSRFFLFSNTEKAEGSFLKGGTCT